VPCNPRYRRCFVAPPGRVLVKADYSQLQLRIAAKTADERRMKGAFGRGEDLHTLTARQLTGKAEVTRADRQLAKVVNFRLLFGLGAKGLRGYAKSNYLCAEGDCLGMLDPDWSCVPQSIPEVGKEEQRRCVVCAVLFPASASPSSPRWRGVMESGPSFQGVRAVRDGAAGPQRRRDECRLGQLLLAGACLPGLSAWTSMQ
jgi:hypothetical protein